MSVGGQTAPPPPRSILGAVVRGSAIAITIPGLVLFSTAVGFGALARDLGFTLGHALFVSTFLYALPAQVLLVDELARGAALLTVAFAVSLTGVRLLPMTIVLMPNLKSVETPRWLLVLAVHFVAITSWLEGMRRLPDEVPRLRPWLFIGLGLGMLAVTLTGTATGYLLSGAVPPVIAAVLLFMTPVYFLLSLAGPAKTRTDHLAIVLGGLLGPALHVLLPGFDLLLAGLLGGGVAWFIGRTSR